MCDVPGFPQIEDSSTPSTGFQKKKKSKNGSGGFQSMNLSSALFNGIKKRGYKIPTPIQRKTIPLILEGRDVVAMAKTGSGKTACFLIPMFERLKIRNPTIGARALILSPTRELAVQTYKFIKDLGKFMDLKTILVLGGDSMDSQFSAIHTCPDIVVATPGRFLHLCVEMDLKLNSIEYVVFDEADRLFEMGFGEQLNEIINRLPSSKQTVMFSATLPKVLVDFANVGLNEPTLIRLDLNTKLPETLCLKYIYCRSDERYTSLIALLKYIIKGDKQTAVFAGTHHHVELISFILNECGITNTSVYSTLDATARKINTAKFTHKKVSVLVVTDVAARGIDIPNLDYVINFHFPGSSKLFVHRVGRCARAGRPGTAFTLFSNEDAAHLLDLQIFLDRPFDLTDNKTYGIIPNDLLEDEYMDVKNYMNDINISGVFRTSQNAYKKYLTSRPVASTESNARVKKMKFYALKVLDDFQSLTTPASKTPFNALTSAENEKKETECRLLNEKRDFLLKIREFKPNNTIFDIAHKQKPRDGFASKNLPTLTKNSIRNLGNNLKENIQNSKDDDQEIELGHSSIENNKKTKKQKQSATNIIDEKNYIPYEAKNRHTENGLAINSFQRQAMNAEFSVIDRANNDARQSVKPGAKRWDRLKKKMVAVQDYRAGKIRTESGAWIAASFKTGRYDEWKEKSKIEEQLAKEYIDDDDDEGNDEIEAKRMKFNQSHSQRYPMSRIARHNAKVAAKKNATIPGERRKGNEMRNPDQIVKARMRLELIKRRNAENAVRKAENRKRSMRNYQKVQLSAAKGNKKRK